MVFRPSDPRRLAACLPAIAFLALTTARPARADLIPYHGISYAYAAPDYSLDATYAGGPRSGLVVGKAATSTGDVASQSDRTSFGYGLSFAQTLRSNASARTSLDASSLLGASSSATASAIAHGSFGIGFGGAFAQSFAAWTDVAFVDGPSRPNRLEFTFAFEGRVSADPGQGLGNYTGHNSLSTADVSWSNRVEDFSKFTSGESPFNEAGLSGGGVRVGYYNDSSANWTLRDGVVRGEATFETSYNPALGGYGFAIELFTRVTSDGLDLQSAATSDFLHTLSLTKVATPDGTSIPVRFDSGLTLQAVPEPSSLTLFAVAAVPGFWYARMRRRQVAGAECLGPNRA